MTLLICREGIEDIINEIVQKLGYPIKIFDNKDDMISEALKTVDAGAPVLLIFKDAWNNWKLIKDRTLKVGVNRFLIDLIDPVEFSYARDLIDPTGLVIAKYTALLNFMAHKALYRTNPNKPVDRRTLLLRPHTAFFEYLPAPILLSPEACTKWKYCNACIEACPFNALEGKPPSVKLDICTGCGLCTAACPFGLLYMPQYNLKSFEMFLSTLRSRIGSEPAWILAVCRNSLVKIKEALGSNEAFSRLFIVPVECPGWFTQFHMVSAILQGFQPIVYCDAETTERCGGADTVKKWSEELSTITDIIITDDIEEIKKFISQRPKVRVLEGVPMLHQDRATILNIFRAYGIEKLTFSTPLVGMVNVNDEKCLVCDACSNMCPFQALRVRYDNDKRNLEFNMSRCTACGICEAICPYNAIKVGYSYNKDYDKGWRVVASDEVARCRRCGKPIGSMKYLKYLEKKLKESGADPWVIEQLWLCQECKIKALIEKQMLGNKGDNE